jgi:hypothetical protein
MALSFRSAVQAHDGMLWACPTPPRGSIFQFALGTNTLRRHSVRPWKSRTFVITPNRRASPGSPDTGSIASIRAAAASFPIE